MADIPKYELELWVNGALVGDITKLAQNRKFSFRRNASEELAFDLDIKAFEDYCALMGTTPAILEPYVTDVLVKRMGEYYFGTQVVESPMEFNKDGETMSVRATGYLDLFKDRYITKSYSGIDRAEIARDMLATSQTDPLDDWGVENGDHQYNTGITDTERNYVDQNIRDALVNLTDLSDGNFDFKFNYDRTFETFAQIGNDRPNNTFYYPGNIKGLSITKTAINLYNYITGIGAGFGDEALRTITADGVSRLNYGTRQAIQVFNSVSVQDTLDLNTYAYLQKVKSLLLLPKLKISGEFADLGIIGIGDRVPIQINRPAIQLDGTYRIEQIDCSLDSNDAEDIDITVDDFGL